MLNIVINDNGVFLDGSLDFMISVDNDKKNVPTADEIHTVIADSLKELFQRKMKADTPKINLDTAKIDAAPKVNLDTTQLDTAISKTDELIAKLKTVKLLMDCLNKT